MRFEQSHTVLFESHASHMIVSLRLRWYWYKLERWQIGSPTRLMCPVRPCCAETHGSCETRCDSHVYNNTAGNGGKPSCVHTYIDLSNFCHFLRNKDSKYCFFNCNRCSLRFNNGHLFTLRAYLIFLHRASKALSKAANSFMLVSWSRLLRNIHS